MDGDQVVQTEGQVDVSDDWGQAQKDFLEDKGVESPAPTQTEPPAKETPETPPEEPATPETPPEETPETPPEGQEEQPAPEVDEVQARREAEAETEAVRNDIRENLFSHVPREIVDKEGDVIRTVEDVMQRINPQTGEAFTEQEANFWLLSAQNKIDKGINEAEKEVERLVDLHNSIHEDLGYITSKYADLIKADPARMKEIYSEWKQSLEVNAEHQIITKAPVSLRRTFDLALKGDLKLATENQARAEAEAKAQKDQSRKQDHSDRSDVTAFGKSTAILDDLEAGWDKAARDYYEDQLN